VRRRPAGGQNRLSGSSRGAYGKGSYSSACLKWAASGGAWPAKIVSAKYHAVEACWRIVDKAMEVSGGAGMFRANELERLFRDARCGRFHPANTFLVHEIVAKTALASTSANSRAGASKTRRGLTTRNWGTPRGGFCSSSC